MWWSLVERIVFPPAGPLLLGLLGMLLWWRPLGRWLVLACLLVLYVLSTPGGSAALVAPLEGVEPLTMEDVATDSAVIVVLAGGRLSDAPEYDGDTVNQWSMQRARYGARLHRELGFPVLVSGGRGEAELIVDLMEEEFGVPVRWMDNASRNTQENAFHTAELLRDQRPDAVLLVTNAIHFPRALPAFERTGLQNLTPAPTGYFYRPDPSSGFNPWDLVPGAYPMTRSYMALHEYVGRAWYWLWY